jgi:lipopolysaccharide/colanic/teichoic acid biosynthesis glycosyltransferase
MKLDRAIIPAGALPGQAASEASHYRRIMRLASYAMLALGDLAGLGASFVVAGAVVAVLGGQVLLADWAMRPALAILPLFLAIAIQRKPYSSRFLADRRRSTRDTMSALVTASAVSLLVVLHADQHIWRACAVVALGTVLGCGWLVAWHKLAERIIGTLLQGQPITMIAILDDMTVDLPGDMHTIFAGAEGLRPDRNDPAALDALGQAIAGYERVVIACSPERRGLWLDVLQGANVQGEFLAPELDSIGMLRTARVGLATTAVVSLGPLDTANRIVKRLLDLSVALSALMVLWPVLLAVAVAVRLDSAGPILFRQPRVGRGNRLFNVYKFRSMRTDMADLAGGQSTGRVDPRVTRVGAIIRRTSVDELPQIFNVLNGTMSIVGPRPHAVASKAAGRLFWEVDARYWHRHAIKPGITGLAQVKGWRGATETVDDLTNRVALDTAYMRGWSVWRDIGIILRTVMVVFHKNAY